MYQVWVSTGAGALQRGPRFRSITDAIAHVRAHAAEGSFAIQTPVGTWYRDPASGRTIFGGAASDDTPTLARGSRTIDVSAHRGPRAVVAQPRPDDDGATTDVRWPPGDGPTVPRKIYG